MRKRKQKSQGVYRPHKPYSVRKRKYQNLKKTVLIVDDDELLLRAACRLLQNDWNIYTARSAVEATAILEGKRFDAVITDYEMPGENGVWLLEKVRHSNPDIRRVLFSCIGPENLLEHITSGLVGRFVTKPTCRADLLSALNP